MPVPALIQLDISGEDNGRNSHAIGMLNRSGKAHRVIISIHGADASEALPRSDAVFVHHAKRMKCPNYHRIIGKMKT